MVRSFHMLAPLTALKDLLSDSDAFRTFTGTATKEDTEAAVYEGYATGTGPLANIALVDLESTGFTNSTFETAVGLMLRIERETPDDEADAELREKYVSFLGAAELVLKDLLDMTAGQLDKLNIAGVELANPPQIVDPEDDTERTKDRWRCDWNLLVRC